eukprot:TRINITY_DN5852_c0_g2_i2.p1 TRINITY_DN5852_c0_g2~~TRINITY_DN5852_c0_g2_i2.p1  ORF type:complete len:143 (-),score=39.24 TRINITY_DN5852_c0_g2_i2:395-781(-)
MEPPVSLAAEDIRNEKVKVLRCVRPASFGTTIVGQYEGYRKEKDVPPESVTPTFAVAVLCVQNQRWSGVPFFLKCGKGLNERKAEIRVQFRPSETFLFEHTLPNELVVRIQPNEAVYQKMMTKVPFYG